MRIGHIYLEREFGVRPTVGWHIDPFGHSNANPRLFAEMGFDAWIFSRLDFQDRDQRLKDKSMEFIWRPFFDHLGKSAEIFTSIMYNHYYWPNGFNYDQRDSQDEPVITDETLSTFNADKKV